MTNDREKYLFISHLWPCTLTYLPVLATFSSYNVTQSWCKYCYPINPNPEAFHGLRDELICLSNFLIKNVNLLFFGFPSHLHFHFVLTIYNITPEMENEGASVSSSSKKRRPALPLLSVTPPSMSSSACSVAGDIPRSRGSSLGSVKMFLQHSPTASLLHLPTFGMSPSNGDGSGRRFSFSLRRFSSQVNLLCPPAECVRCSQHPIWDLGPVSRVLTFIST